MLMSSLGIHSLPSYHKFQKPCSSNHFWNTHLLEYCNCRCLASNLRPRFHVKPFVLPPFSPTCNIH
uniref:Uncharacterized protein n=1 Tax=Arundo donax TaxID=35708 RepID=A0A0A9HN16_ARUDO